MLRKGEIGIFEEMIGEKDEFAHEDGKGELFGLSCSEEAEVKRLENRVIAGGDERGHVESGADLGTTAADVAAAAVLAAVAIEGSDAGESVSVISSAAI